MTAKADYGIDAPGVVRNLFIAGGAGLIVWATAVLGVWTGRLDLSFRGVQVVVSVAGTGLAFGLGCTLMAAWMIWDSKAGKLASRERLLGRIPWTGTERVLDVGCGRGLLVVGAAKRLTGGKATGIDIWQSEDLSGNRADATLENARREGVADRVEVRTADMRKMPFDEGTFDVVVSRAAIHNLSDAGDRVQAIREIARVLKPGGRAVIEDIRNTRQYAAVFAESGCPEARRSGSVVLSSLLAVITFGSLNPGTLVVRRSEPIGGTRPAS